MAPWYWNQLAADRARLAELDAVREGRAAAVTSTIPLPPEYSIVAGAARFEPDVFRAMVETVGYLTLPQEVFARPGLWDKVVATAPDEPMTPNRSAWGRTRPTSTSGGVRCELLNEMTALLALGITRTSLMNGSRAPSLISSFSFLSRCCSAGLGRFALCLV